MLFVFSCYCLALAWSLQASDAVEPTSPRVIVQSLNSQEKARAEVHLHASPERIVPGITPTLVINCTCSGPSDDNSSLALGRITNARFHLIASKDPSDEPKSTEDLGNGYLKGNVIATKIGVTRTISVEWKNPEISQAGVYTCAAKTGSHGKAKAILTDTLTVKTHTLTNEEITRYLREIKEEVQNMKNSIADGAELKKLSQTVAELSQQSRIPEHANAMIPIVREALFSTSDVFQKKRYVFAEYTPASNAKAQTVCNAMGGYLAEIDSQHEYTFLLTFIRGHMTNKQLVMLGSSDSFHEGKWVNRNTSTPTAVLDWWPGQPNNGGGTSENCLALTRNFLSQGIHMNDVPCFALSSKSTPWTYSYICEIPENSEAMTMK